MHTRMTITANVIFFDHDVEVKKVRLRLSALV